ncbi:MAG: tetratricopeptide repeat protein [Phycisphaeraceae bacterium]|nr:MAG: tetratricopeptide repeat protein [Phycisphaeraceae bacterium]
MAGRVNTKFVVVLVVSAVVVLGAGLGLFYKIVNKTGETHAAKAREFEAAGDWSNAADSWERAVGHEQTNIPWLRSWRDALGHIAPDTQTEYEGLFSRYVMITKQIAATLRTDPDEAAEYLDLRSVFFRRLGGAGRQQVEMYVNELDAMLANFPETTVPEQRNRLRRYRGIAWSALSGPASPLTADEIKAAKEDLRAALSANPGDGESLRALLSLLETEKDRATQAKQPERVAAFNEEERAAVDALLEADPEDPWGRVSRLELALEPTLKLPEAERAVKMQSMLADLDSLVGWVGDHVAETDTGVIDRIGVLEAALDPASNATRTEGLFQKAAEALNNRSDLLLKLAAIRLQKDDYDGAVALIRQVEDQPTLPISVEGRLRLIYKAQAPRQLAEFAVMRVEKAQSDEEVASLLKAAHDARERFVSKVGTDSPTVEMLDGQIAIAEAQRAARKNDDRAASDAYKEALNHFAKYNEVTEYKDKDGLWREGQTAIMLNKTGLARQRFERLRELDPQNPDVLLALAAVEEQLGTASNYNEALLLVGQALELRPSSEAIRARRDRLRQLVGQVQPDDPIEAAMFEAERLATGSDGQTPDAIGAERVIREALKAHPDSSKLIRQLVRVLVLSDRLDDARAFIRDAAKRLPDDEAVAKLAHRLEATSLVEILIGDIEDSDSPRLGKVLKEIEVYRRYGQNDKADALLAEATELAPNDPDVLEQRFLQKLVAGDFDSASTIADEAKRVNADRLEGITFQARLLAARGQHQQAVELLREAVARITTEAPLWRLLASEQVELGRINDAVESFRRALEITEDDPTTIRGYIATLASAGRNDEALSEARRLRDYGAKDPAFLDIYLKLEAGVGGTEGRQIAIERRKQLLGERPFDTDNKLELAELYIDNRQWDEAKKLIDGLEGDAADSLRRVEVLAKWYADQGKVRTADGFKDGIELARGAFITYIVSHDPKEVGVDAYIAMARFMMSRGRDDVALRAVQEARQYQDPMKLRPEKLLGEIMMQRNMPRQAAEAFEKVVDAGADDKDDRYRKLLIEMLLRINDFDGADKQIAALGDSYADDLTVLMQKVDIAMARDQVEAAQKLVDRAMQVHPTSSLPYIKRAQILMPDPTRWRDAQRNLEEALRISPNDFQAHKLMATMHFRNDRTDDAIKELRTSLECNPYQDGLLVATLIELLEQNRDGEAVDVANAVIEKRPTDATLMLIAGRVFTQRERWARAAALFERAWRLTKDERVGLAFINTLLSATPPKTDVAAGVIADLERLGTKIDEDPVLLGARAQIEQKAGKPARAQGFLTRAYEQALANPGLIMQWFRDVKMVFDGADEGEGARFMLAQRDKMPEGTEQRDWLTYGAALLRTQDQDNIPAAETDLKALISGSKSEVIRRLASRLLGSGRYDRKDFEGAAEAWRAGIAAFPDDWEMHNNLAYCLGVDMGKPEEGIPLARQATQLADGRADVYDTLGGLLLRTGQLDEAEDALFKADERLQTERERVVVLLNKARLRLAQGRLDEAIRVWTDAETAVYTLPSMRDQVQEDLDDVKAQIDSKRGHD